MVSVVLMLAGLLHVHGNCFHQSRDDSFIKLPKTSSVFLPRELRNLRVSVLIEVKMEIMTVLIRLV